MQLFAAIAAHRNQVCLFQDEKMLRYRLAAHCHAPTQLAHVLATSGVQPIEEVAPIRVGEGAKHTVVIHRINIQPSGCMSRGSTEKEAAVRAGARRFQGARAVPPASGGRLHPGSKNTDGPVHPSSFARSSTWASHPLRPVGASARTRPTRAAMPRSWPRASIPHGVRRLSAVARISRCANPATTFIFPTNAILLDSLGRRCFSQAHA